MFLSSLIVPTAEMAQHVWFVPKSVVACDTNKANHLLGFVSVGLAHRGKLLYSLGVGDTRLGTLHAVLGPFR